MMEKLVLIILLSFILNEKGSSSPVIIIVRDTVDNDTRIKKLWKQFKKDNKIQIHKYESRDSTIWLGSNKQKSFLASVMVSIRVNQESTWFFYNSKGIFRVSILDNKKTKILNKRKKAACTYYFENGNLFHKIEEGKTREPSLLLIEAKKYQELARHYLAN